ncbi:MAG: hypothetical protein AAGH41_14930 [Pseudomonadota bacterium]
MLAHRALLSTVVVFGFATVAEAETKEIDHTFCGVAATSTIVPGEDHGVYHTSFHGVISADNASDPLNGTTGRCDVMHEWSGAGGDHIRTVGYCVATDLDGDSVTMLSERDDGGVASYTILRGTGKWEGATGQATATPVALGKRDATGQNVICSQLDGEITTP